METRRTTRAQRTRSFAAILPALLGLASAGALAAPDPLRIGMSGDYPPMHAWVDGEATGFEADVGRLLGEALGRPVAFVDPRRLGMSTLEAVAAGEIDLGMSAITPTPARDAIVDFTAPYATLRYRLAGLGDGSSVDPNAAIAVSSALAEQAVRESLPMAAVVRTRSSAEALAVATAGEVIGYVDEDVGLIRKLSGTPLSLLPDDLGASPIAAAIGPGVDPAPFDAAIEAHAEAIAALFARWRVGQPAVEPASPRAADPEAIASAFVDRHLARASAGAAGEELPCVPVGPCSVADALEFDARFAWHRLFVDGRRFVSAMRIGDDLLTRAGTVQPARLTITSTTILPLAPALRAALEAGARPGRDSGEVPLPVTLYNLERLPRHLRSLGRPDGEWVEMEWCDDAGNRAYRIHPDPDGPYVERLLGRHHDREMSVDGVDGVDGATRTGNVYTLWFGPDDTLEITWPYEGDPGTAELGSRYATGPGIYPFRSGNCDNY